MIKILSLIIVVTIVSGCIDTSSVKETVQNKTTEIQQYANNISVPDPCVKISGNITCVSDINVSIKLNK
jgi:hypothetical protein